MEQKFSMVAKTQFPFKFIFYCKIEVENIKKNYLTIAKQFDCKHVFNITDHLQTFSSYFL